MSEDLYREIYACARRGTDQIEHCKNVIERKIEDDTMAFLLKQQAEAAHDASTGRFFYRLKITLGNTFRYTLLSGVCAVLEECVNAIVMELIPDEKAKEKANREAGKAVRAKKGSTNWLLTAIELFVSKTGVSRTKNFGTDVDQFTDIITLRNCICHVWGNVTKSKRPAQVEEAVKRLQEIETKENTKLVRISDDGYLILGRDMVSQAICPAVDIVDYLCDATLAYEKRKAP